MDIRRYQIFYSYGDPCLTVKDSTSGDWVDYSDVEQLIKELDELRAKLAEMESQQPAFYLDWEYDEGHENPADGGDLIPYRVNSKEYPHGTEFFAKPVPADKPVALYGNKPISSKQLSKLLRDVWKNGFDAESYDDIYSCNDITIAQSDDDKPAAVPKPQKCCAYWRNDAIEQAANVADRYEQKYCAQDIRNMLAAPSHSQQSAIPKEWREIVDAVAHIGVDVGFGVYEISDEQIDKARKLMKCADRCPSHESEQ